MDKRNKFQEEVYGIVRTIPCGKVMTYGQIALLAGKPGRARQVGNVLSGASVTLNLPCHRVVNGQGRLVPGWEAQRVLLEKEGVVFKKNGYVDMKRFQWDFMNEEETGL